MEREGEAGGVSRPEADAAGVRRTHDGDGALVCTAAMSKIAPVLFLLWPAVFL